MESDPSTGGRGFGTFLIVWIEVPDALEAASR
jgi:hypothetical protein